MLTVDTLKAYQDLRTVEFSDAQAQAIVGVIKSAQEIWLEKLATKEDLNALRNEFKEMESRLEVKIANLETKIERAKFDLIKWLLPFIIGQLALTATLLLRSYK